MTAIEFADRHFIQIAAFAVAAVAIWKDEGLIAMIALAVLFWGSR